MIEIKVRLFGAFRKYESNQTFIHLKVLEPSSIDTVKVAIASYFRERFENFSDEQLLNDSVIADESQVLETSKIIDRSCTLAILPPVCGG